MQFLERSILGLRSAKHVLKSHEHAAEVTLFPMVHVGEASFYDDVTADLLQMDIVLLEGIRSPTTRALTRVYRWLPLRRLGLVVQPQIGPTLEKAGIKVVRADMKPEDFEAAWAGVPRSLKVWVPIAVTLVALWLRLTGTRAKLAKRMNTTDLPSRERVLSAGGVLDPMDALIRDQRDTILIAALRAALEANAQRPVRIGIVYGAAHMPAVVRALPDFAPTESFWMTVFPM